MRKTADFSTEMKKVEERMLLKEIKTSFCKRWVWLSCPQRLMAGGLLRKIKFYGELNEEKGFKK